MSQRNKAIIALVVTAVLWSSGGVLIKWVNWHPMAIMGARSAIAAALLWVIARRLRFRWSPAFIGGAVAYAVTVMLYVPAVTLTTAANAILLQYTAPLWIALFGAWFLGERATWIDWLCILVSLGGMVLFFHEGLASKSFVGDLLGALSGITLAWSMLLLRKQKDGTPLECVLLGNVLAALGGLPFAFGRPVPNAMGWVALLYLGIMQLGLAYALYAWAIKHVTALESVLIVMLEPILNPIWALLLIGERPQGWALVGGLLVLAAATMRGVLLAVHKPRSAAAP
jgi:drug/metabolite transporter (DMT)-like permease